MGSSLGEIPEASRRAAVPLQDVLRGGHWRRRHLRARRPAVPVQELPGADGMDDPGKLMAGGMESGSQPPAPSPADPQPRHVQKPLKSALGAEPCSDLRCFGVARCPSVTPLWVPAEATRCAACELCVGRRCPLGAPLAVSPLLFRDTGEGEDRRLAPKKKLNTSMGSRRYLGMNLLSSRGACDSGQQQHHQQQAAAAAAPPAILSIERLESNLTID